MISNSIKTIIFDFDGVILNSNYIKTEMFYKLFKKYGERTANRIVSYHIKFTGISRKIKFRYIFKKILREKINKSIIKNLDDEFKKNSFKKIEKLKVSKYLYFFLKKNYKKYNFYISTGAPRDEIIKLLKKKNLKIFFKKIFGPPQKKTKHINFIKKLKSGSILFVGDSLEDYKAAKQCKIPFILKKHKENNEIFKKKKILKISNFKNFERTINKI